MFSRFINLHINSLECVMITWKFYRFHVENFLSFNLKWIFDQTSCSSKKGSNSFFNKDEIKSISSLIASNECLCFRWYNLPSEITQPWLIFKTIRRMSKQCFKLRILSLFLNLIFPFYGKHAISFIIYEDNFQIIKIQF